VEIRVDFYKANGKWYAGGVVNVGATRLWHDGHALLNAIRHRQEIIAAKTDASWRQWTVVSSDLPENEANPEYKEFFKAVLQIGEP
jgi:hypothetical protein